MDWRKWSYNIRDVGWMPLAEYRKPSPVTPSPVSMDTPGDKRNLPVEKRFEDALRREHATKVNQGEKMEEALSEPREDLDTGATPAEKKVPGSYSPTTIQELLQDLSGE